MDDPRGGESLHGREEEILEFWEREGVFRFDFEDTTRPVFSIDTPPPTVSGKMHIGHAYSYNQMDFVARYKRMRGYNVFYPFGFDDNGLPTERYTEKRVGVKITDVGREEFIRLCLEETRKAEREMERSWRRTGISCDWSIVYRTIDSPVVKISQESFVDLYEKGRAYRAERPTIFCPECRTAIAQVEMEDKKLPSTFYDIAFDLEGGEVLPSKEGEGSYVQGKGGRIIISTTRPELLLSCVAIFVHPEDPRTVHLVGKKARVPLLGELVPILSSEKVERETGTGVVMCCTFGDQTDVEWWQEHHLPLRTTLGPDGRMNESAGSYRGLGIREARDRIRKDLDAQGRLLGEKSIEHTVNVHERCQTPIELLVTRQWFVRYLDLKEKFLELGRAVSWHPPHMRVRYENWVRGLKWDWCISRQRFFGVPFPVWYCRSCGKEVVARREELPVDPLRVLPSRPCPSCGGRDFAGEPDVMDTWATSALTPQIALLVASERMGVGSRSLREMGEVREFSRFYPMSLRAQAHEIISFWAFHTIVKSYLHHGSIPWKDIMVSGFVKLGKGKMSKSRGNIVEPLDVVRQYSADALRYWSASGATLGEDIVYDPKELTRGQRLVTKLRNVASFAGKALRGWRAPSEELPDLSFSVLDRWILSEYSDLVQRVTESWEDYDYRKALWDTEEFFWHTLADHYLEAVKHRVFGQGPDSEAARWTLHAVVGGTVRLLAPILSFSTEEIYQEHFRREGDPRSIHQTSWPRPLLRSPEAQREGAIVRDVIASIRSWKSSHKIPLNAPLGPLVVVAPPFEEGVLRRARSEILGTIRASDLAFEDPSLLRIDPLSVEGVPKRLGPKFRENSQKVEKALSRLDPSKVDEKGLVLSVEGVGEVVLEEGDYVVQRRISLEGSRFSGEDPLVVGNIVLFVRRE